MTNHSLRGVAVSALQPTTSVWLQAANLCGLYREVSQSRDSCMCFAGYEEAITSDLDRYCAPCMPGTFDMGPPSRSSCCSDKCCT